MPVKISPVSNSDNPEVITLEEYTLGRENFDMHYFHTASALPFDGKDFSIPWDDLNIAVNDFVTTAGVSLSDVCLRFVHCFDASNATLYLRVQVCTFYETPITDHGKKLFALDTTNQAWYVIQQDNFAPTTDEALMGVVYFNSFYYSPVEGSEVLQRLSDGKPDKFVRNIVFPWESEILQMYIDNDTAEEGMNINFGACSYTHSNPGDESVTWPHGLVMYLSDADGNKLLDNDAYISIFHNKGADNGTLCPPVCNGYLKPIAS